MNKSTCLSGWAIVLCVLLFAQSSGTPNRNEKLNLNKVIVVTDEIQSIIADAKSNQNGDVFDAISQKLDVLMRRLDPKAPEWPTIRRQLAESMFQIRENIENAIDPDFNMANAPPISVSPGSHYPSGIAPEAITEPEIRKSYEEKLEQNRREIQKYNFQIEIRKLDHDYQIILEQFLFEAYLTPKNAEELQKIMLKYNFSKDGMNRVLQKLKNPQ